jgi:hypothetical protein
MYILFFLCSTLWCTHAEGPLCEIVISPGRVDVTCVWTASAVNDILYTCWAVFFPSFRREALDHNVSTLPSGYPSVNANGGNRTTTSYVGLLNIRLNLIPFGIILFMLFMNTLRGIRGPWAIGYLHITRDWVFSSRLREHRNHQKRIIIKSLYALYAYIYMVRVTYV